MLFSQYDTHSNDGAIQIVDVVAPTSTALWSKAIAAINENESNMLNVELPVSTASFKGEEVDANDDV